MEELVRLRRKRNVNSQLASEGKIDMRFTVKDGRFILYQSLIRKLGLNDGDSVMFGVSRKENCLYIFKEEACEDNYTVKQAGGKRSYLRFTSKNLTQDIINYLGLDKDKQDYFFESANEMTDGKLKLIEYKREKFT